MGFASDFSDFATYLLVDILSPVHCVPNRAIILALGAVISSFAADRSLSATADILYAEESAGKLAKMHQAWGPELNSENASLLLKEVFRASGIVKYQLYAAGLPHQAKYSIMSWPVTQGGPSEVLGGVTLNESGLAICAGVQGTCGTADQPNDPISLTLTPVKGEPFRIALVSAENPKDRAFLNVVPIPNEATDKGCVVDSVLLLRGAAAVVITGSGFEPNSELMIQTSSEGERHDHRGQAGKDGRYFSVILPYKKGLNAGTTFVTLRSSVCSPSLSFKWGVSSNHN